MIRERGGTVAREFRIAELVDYIAAGEMVLPEFQRDFDWADDRVIQLLATVIRRWPAGSLLLQEFPGETFYKLRGFDGGPSADRSAVRYVVLDGQQRLTALFHAIYDTGPYVYAIRAGSLTLEASIDEVEEGIQSFTRTEWDREIRSRGWAEDHDWIPFYSLRSAADFFAWRDAQVDRTPERTRARAAESLSDAYRLGLEAFHTYAVPAVVVEKRLEAEAIARIFERVNRGGLPLSAFDLMVAKTFEPGWNLRDRWDAARANDDRLDDFFGDDGMPVIRVIALEARNSVREGDVLRLRGQDVRGRWDDAIAAVSAAVSALVETCGVARPEWMPYGGMITTLGGVALEYDLTSATDIVRPWFLSRSFGLRYDGGANTVTVEEYHHLEAVFGGKAELGSIPISRGLLADASRKRRSAIWRAFLAVLSAEGACDPVTGDLIEIGRPVPILPRPESPPTAGTEPNHLLVMNQLLASPRTARELNGRGVAALYQAIDRLSAQESERVRISQLLPQRVQGFSEREFLKQRASVLAGYLETHLGYALLA